MRQFGMFQNVPDAPLFNHNDCVREHSVSRLGKSNHNWEAEQGVYIDRWHERHESIQTSFLVNDYTPSPEYIAWFHPRTVQYIANPGSTPHGFQPLGEQREFLMDGMTRWHNESVDQGDENLSQQYMSYMHNNERFSHEPSNYVENYDPVPQQMFQRDTRRRRQPRSNVDDVGPSSVIKQKKTHF